MPPSWAAVGQWDPLGFNKSADEANSKGRQAVEIKHGRISVYVIGVMKGSTEKDQRSNYGVGFPIYYGKIEDPEMRKKEVAAELVMGRLGLLAVIGKFFQGPLRETPGCIQCTVTTMAANTMSFSSGSRRCFAR